MKDGEDRFTVGYNDGYLTAVESAIAVAIMAELDGAKVSERLRKLRDTYKDDQ